MYKQFFEKQFLKTNDTKRSTRLGIPIHHKIHNVSDYNDLFSPMHIQI